MLKSILASIIVGITIIFVGYAAASTSYQLPINVYYNQLNPFARSEIKCLADNIYFESAYEPEQGQIAVAFVTLNRRDSGFFPDSICDVVKQRTQQVCQFTWYCENTVLTRVNEKVYNEIMKLAIHVYANHDKMKDPSRGALFYHADYVNPGWKNMIRTATIGRHIFYNRKDMIS